MLQLVGISAARVHFIILCNAVFQTLKPQQNLAKLKWLVSLIFLRWAFRDSIVSSSFVQIAVKLL